MPTLPGINHLDAVRALGQNKDSRPDVSSGRPAIVARRHARTGRGVLGGEGRGMIAADGRVTNAALSDMMFPCHGNSGRLPTPKGTYNVERSGH